MSGCNKYKIKWTYDTCYEEAKKYKSHTEFKDACVGAYDKSRKMKWIEDYVWFTRVTNKKYSYEQVKSIAEKCDTLAEFTKNHVGAYEAALKNGWLNDFTHLKRKNSYTPESIIELCKDCTCISDLIKKNQSAYNAFLMFYKRGDITDVDVPWYKKRRSSWSYEDCYEEAKKYESLLDFKTGSESAYNRARIEGWLKDYVWFKKLRNKYTLDICKDLASKCKSRTEFQKKYGGAYRAASKFGWIDEFNFGENKIKWTPELVIDICKKYKTKRDVIEKDKHAYDAFIRFKRKGVLSDDDIRWESAIRKGNGDPEAKIHYVYAYIFEDNSVYVGRTIDPKKRDRRHRKQHHSHRRIKEQTVLRYSIDTNVPIPEMTILESELNMQESRKREAYWVDYYKDNGYNVLNTGVVGEYTGSVGSFSYKWTKDAVIEYAKQFKKLSHLQSSNRQCAIMVKKYGLLDELFPDRQKRESISYEEAKEKALGCNTRTEFHKKYSKHYNTSRTHGWLDDFFPKK